MSCQLRKILVGYETTIARRRGDLVSFETEGSRRANSTMVRLVGSDCGGKEVSDVRCVSCRVYSVNCVQSHGILANQIGERNLVNVADTSRLLYCGAEKKYLYYLCTTGIILFT